MSTFDYPQLYIDGQWVEAQGGATYSVVNPATEAEIGRAADASSEDMERAISAARRAFDSGPWPQMPARDRAGFIRRIADGLEKKKEKLRELLIAEAGAEDFLLAAQLENPILALHWYAELALKFDFEQMLPVTMGHSPAGPALGYTLVNHQPAGVCGLIPTWNFPLYVTAQKIGPALAAGCTMVVKPPPYTPLINLELAKVVDESGLPPGVLNVVSGQSSEISEHLVASRHVDKISFTGSIGIGKRIAQTAAQSLKRVHLELGGKSAALVLEDIDPAVAAPGLAAPTYVHAGQVCGAATRCFVPRKLYEAVLTRMVDFVNSLPVGDPVDRNVIVGPVIREERRRKIEEYIQSGLDQGARLVAGGERPGNLKKGYFIKPTIFADVDNKMRIAREEIFGPVLSVIPYTDLEEAVRSANDSDFGLAGIVVTNQPATGMEIAKRLRSGWISLSSSGHMVGLGPNAPFGGFKASGLGREGGKWGLMDFTEIQTVTW
ncbi:MAG TPA: aldehyde dehydrogenase family protein [Candidatus Binataceae bacterium]|nr:aldehyde dehydrogenase family protein [Candidatus Binataceae bacterium]